MLKKERWQFEVIESLILNDLQVQHYSLTYVPVSTVQH